VGTLRRVGIIVAYVVVFWAVLPLGLFGAGRLVDRLPWFADFPSWARILGVPLIAVGGWLCAHASMLLRTQGKGLPISSLPPTQYVTTGPYRRLRHPIYTGFIGLAAGLGLLLGSPGTALVVVPTFAALWFATWVRLYEEPLLLQRFGASFRAHRDRTGLLLPLSPRLVLRAVVLALFRMRVPIRAEGSHHVPAEGPVVVVSDHLSYLDFMFGQFICARPITIPVTAEVYRHPARRLFMKLMGGVPKRRFGADPGAALALADAFVAGDLVGIAIEGERSWTGEMQLPPMSVAHNVGRFGCPVVPVAFVGSYRFWPRWAGGRDPRAGVEIRVGEPFRVEEELDDFVPGDRSRAAEIAQLLVDRIQALRDPEEPAVHPMRYPSTRPELVLWRCPLCGVEESLAMDGRRYLRCGACHGSWDTFDGDFTLLEPRDRAGERHTLAGWAAAAGGVGDIPAGDGPVIEAAAELREDPHAGVTLAPLTSLGPGRAELHRDHIAWRGEECSRRLPLRRIHSVTTERNDTLQLGTGSGVVQLVFPEASPLRWQLYVQQLLETAHEP
jgi:protein-S-isoprenylcysteine O-methyltransferase Ste14